MAGATTSGLCTARGPKGARCVLRRGHDGDHRSRHRRTPLTWSTPAAGWPRTLPCLKCGRSRSATWAGDRLHADCRMAETAWL